MHREILTDTWRMRDLRTGKDYKTSAPCSVLSVLLENQEIEDPYDLDHEKDMLPLFESEYEFVTVFSISGEHMMEDKIDLIFEGLDTFADIYLNETLLDSVSDMHRTYRYSVKPFLHKGANEICIHFHSPLKYIEQYQSAPGKEISYTNNGSIFGNQWIRKAHSSFGWDWGPKLPDIGIFKNVTLECYSKAKIQEVFFRQEHGRNNGKNRDRNEVVLTVDPILYLIDRTPVDLEILVSGMDKVVRVIRMPEANEIITNRGENAIRIPIEKPHLWWPNGMGEPYLYDVTVRIRKSDNIYDEKHYRIGLRTLTVSREKDEYGEEFAFVINGNKMFAMGADYIPEDAIYPHITLEKQKKLIESAAEANFNCLRVWGGGYYPTDEFYDLCDEKGIIVWQDLMFACNVYDLTPSLEENIIAEIKDNVRRLRHHACLGLWCGNNEIESAWVNWSDFARESNYLKADYIKIFEYIVPKALREVDDQTFFWPSSPSSGGCFDAPADENRGDSHYWEVWHGQKPFTEYQNHYFRFLSEFGFQSFPCLKTVETYTRPEDHNIFSPIMEAHQKNDSANGKIMAYLADNFLFPKDFDSTLYLSQILQGLAIKSGVEHLRRNRGRCMGALYWQMNDNWPVASWSSIDYFGRWKALHYMARRFYAPAAGSVKLSDHTVTAYVVNDGAVMKECKIAITLYTMDGTNLLSFNDQTWLTSGNVYETKEYDMKRMLDKYGVENVYVETIFTFGNRVVQSECDVFLPYKKMNLLEPEISLDVQEEEEDYAVTLSSPVFTPFVMIDLEDVDLVFEDNVFYLSANHPVTIRIPKDQIPYEDTEVEIDLGAELGLDDLGLDAGLLAGINGKSLEEESDGEYLDEPDTVIPSAENQNAENQNAENQNAEIQNAENQKSENPDEFINQIANKMKKTITVPEILCEKLVLHYLQDTIRK